MKHNTVILCIFAREHFTKKHYPMPELSMLLLFAVLFIVSVRGFRDPVFFRKYMFTVSDVKYKKEYYRFFTCGFLHTDWMHLLLNAITLYFFYITPFDMLGEVRFLVLYTAGLGLSSYFSYAVHKRRDDYAAVGASGAVSAVLFSAIVLHPNLKLILFPFPFPIRGYVFAIAYLLFTTYGLRRQRGNIGHAAHLGGAATGVLLTLAMSPETFSRYPLITTGILVLVLSLIVWELKRQRIF